MTAADKRTKARVARKFAAARRNGGGVWVNLRELPFAFSVVAREGFDGALLLKRRDRE